MKFRYVANRRMQKSVNLVELPLLAAGQPILVITEGSMTDQFSPETDVASFFLTSGE